ncbi:TSUP family transporter [Streptosporangium sp. NPDC002721]|uniref:TSUP family transporter n=1 Tax=Streptosporangium sp. NPDC002721 TaxID=3366188 RepID=UPI0036B14ED5
MVVGIVSGMYGIGGGSLLGPILAGRGLPVTEVAPAAPACTFVTSIAGALTYAVLTLITPGDITPLWALGLLCGLGGLIGGYLGAHLQPRLLLGTLAIALSGLYAAQVLT